MMAANDGPDVATTSGDKGNAADDTEMKQVWRFIYVDMSFVKSVYGILVAAELILSLLGLICVSVPKQEGCAYLYNSTYSYYEFVASSCFIVSILWYAVYALAITKKLGFVRWDLVEIIWCGFYIFNFLVASSVMAAHACFQGGYKAAAAFGFLCLFVIIGHGVFLIRNFLAKRAERSSAQATTTTTDTPANMDDVEEASRDSI